VDAHNYQAFLLMVLYYVSVSGFPMISLLLYWWMCLSC